MANYDFTYELPENFRQEFVNFLIINGKDDLAKLLENCKIFYDDIGYAYYCGIRKGDVWNKRALDFTIESSSSIRQNLEANKNQIHLWLNKFIEPGVSGYIVKNVQFLVRSSDVEITLPENNNENFETLYHDIVNALNRNEPSLVLDRLHTYSTKFFREICKKHDLNLLGDNGEFYPL